MASSPKPNTPLLYSAIALTIALTTIFPLTLHAPWDFLFCLLALLGFCLMLGVLIAGRPLGILITDRNTMSLSRLQLVLWMLLILASYATMALARIAILSQTKGAVLSGALDVVIPAPLLALIGISLTSGVGAAVVQATKSQKTAAPSAVTTATDLNGTETQAQGVLYARNPDKPAQFTDIFEGDELQDTHTIDVAKVQMFFFTVVASVGYVGLTVELLRKGDLRGLPVLPENLVILMGMSHAAYLGSKTVTRTPEATQTVAGPQSKVAGPMLSPGASGDHQTPVPPPANTSTPQT